MQIDDKLKEQIINFGAFKYGSKKIGSILSINEAEIQKEIDNENSEFSNLYQKGQDMADFAIDSKLFEMARNGDIKALNKFEQRKRQINY